MEGITATETATALREVEEIVEQSGRDIKLFSADAPATKDTYGKIIKSTSPPADVRKAYPSRYQPFDRKLRTTVAHTHEAEFVTFISKKKADDDGKSLDFFQRIQRAVYDGREWELLGVFPHMQVGRDYCYYRFEFRKKQAS